MCLCKEFVSSSRHFSIRFLGSCKRFLPDVCLYINTVTGSPNINGLEAYVSLVSCRQHFGSHNDTLTPA